MGDYFFFVVLFLFSYKIHYGKQTFPLERCLPSAVSVSGIWWMCEAQTDCLSFSPLQWSQPPFCPGGLHWGGCLRQPALAACGYGGHTAQSLPKQLICIFKRRLPTQQNKMLQPPKSVSRMVFVPHYGFGCARTSPGIYQNCVAAITPC